jgi:hypothetical protein
MGSILSKSGVCFNIWREFYVEGNAVTQIDNLVKKFAFLIKCSLINTCINICSDCTR